MQILSTLAKCGSDYLNAFSRLRCWIGNDQYWYLQEDVLRPMTSFSCWRYTSILSSFWADNIARSRHFLCDQRGSLEGIAWWNERQIGLLSEFGAVGLLENRNSKHISQMWQWLFECIFTFKMLDWEWPILKFSRWRHTSNDVIFLVTSYMHL